MEKIVEAMAASIGTFSSQNLSNAVMAFAKLEHNPGKLMDAIAKATIAVLDQATPQVNSPLLEVLSAALQTSSAQFLLLLS